MQLADDAIQLLLRIPAILPNGSENILSMLVDTGAEANLVNIELFPSYLLHEPPEKVTFLTANGQPLKGGDLAIDLELIFGVASENRENDQMVIIPGEFYTAEIKVDGILSYPWLKQHKLGVFPDLGALARRDPFCLLTGWEDKKRKLKPHRWVQKNSAHEDTNVQTVQFLHESDKISAHEDANVQTVQFLHEVDDIDLEDDVHEQKEMWELHHDNWQLPLVGEQTRERHLSNQEIWHINRVVKKMVKEERQKNMAVRVGSA